MQNHHVWEIFCISAVACLFGSHWKTLKDSSAEKLSTSFILVIIHIRQIPARQCNSQDSGKGMRTIPSAALDDINEHLNEDFQRNIPYVSLHI